jgi:type IV pilus assembly protein PilQ
VNNEDLTRVLQLLSMQSERNIVASPEVTAQVTADLYGVTFYEALDAILHVNGLGYIEKGNFIYVYTAEQLAAIEAAARVRVSRVVRLNYLNATDAAEFVKNLLSTEGSVTTTAATENFSISGDSPVGADSFANTATLVLYDYEENIEAIQQLLTEIDTKPVQVLVEATILQTTLNEQNAFGVDFSIINNIDFTDFAGSGGPLSVVNGLIGGSSSTVDGSEIDAPAGGNGSGLVSSPGNTAGPGTFKIGLVNEDVAIFVKLLDQVTDSTVISNPKLLTLNRQPGRVLVGTRVGYLNTTTTETSTTQTVEFLDVGTELSVRPFVADNGLIRLELRPQVSNANLRETTGQDGNTIVIPDEDTTELTTNVMVRDGQTVVLGGLFTETTTATRRQVPFLGGVPVIGNAFRGNEDQTRRSEIIFLITPSIVNDTALTEDGELARTYVEHMRVGARAGTLPFSRERQVGQLLIEARQLADSGQVDQAIFRVRRALALSPMAPDARAMLEELTGVVRGTPSRSVMNGAMNRELMNNAADPRRSPYRGKEKPYWRERPKAKPVPVAGPNAAAPAHAAPTTQTWAPAPTAPNTTYTPAPAGTIDIQPLRSDDAAWIPVEQSDANTPGGVIDPFAPDVWQDDTDFQTPAASNQFVTPNAWNPDAVRVESLPPGNSGPTSNAGTVATPAAAATQPEPAQLSALPVLDGGLTQSSTDTVDIADAEGWDNADAWNDAADTQADDGANEGTWDESWGDAAEWDDTDLTADSAADGVSDAATDAAWSDGLPADWNPEAPTAQPSAPTTNVNPAGPQSSATPHIAPGAAPAASTNAQPRPVAKASSDPRDGFLFVPLPGGGTARVPWLTKDQARTQNASLQLFTTAPTDTE